jgi:Icc-related predicted phosphoesterase
MKIFAISDIHGEKRYFERAAGLIGAADLVAIAGDITTSGGRKSAGDVISCVEKYNSNILAVHGNWDGREVIDLLDERGYSLHGRGRTVGGIGFFGVGGSGKTPFGTVSEYSEDEIRGFLDAGFNEIRNAEKVVLISHSPPKRVRDKTFFGLRGGSTSISEFVKAHRISLCIVGHIHEAYGREQLGACVVVNSGPFQRGRYALIDTDGPVTAEIGSFRR